MESAVAYTNQPDSSAAGQELCEGITAALSDSPQAVVVFASPRYDHVALLRALAAGCRPEALVGASSAGEFTHKIHGAGMACALGLRAPEMSFAAALGHGLMHNPGAAAQRLVGGFRGLTDSRYVYRSALVMTDALAGRADELIHELTLATSGQYQFFGGGAGDDGRFQRTYVFFGTRVLSDAAVALEILSDKPIGIGVSHGWEPASPALRVTAACGMRVLSLNGMPAIEAFEEHAAATSQKLDRATPLPFFLHNILGIDTGAGHRLRVPLAIDEAGAVLCAAEIPTGAIVYIMRSSEASAVLAAERATAAAIAALGGRQPKAALFFDCVATRLRIGNSFGLELGALSRKLGNIHLAGCNTYGQIVRAEGQFGGFHNCTAVLCVFSE